jgi:hypothetical protein
MGSAGTTKTFVFVDGGEVHDCDQRKLGSKMGLRKGGRFGMPLGVEHGKESELLQDMV